MNLMKYKWLFFLISGLVIIPGIFSLLTFGLKLSVDFTGGAVIELKFKKETSVGEIEELKEIVEKSGFEFSSLTFSGENQILLRSKPTSKEEVEELKMTLEEKFSDRPEEVRFETVGPVLGKELVQKTITGILLASVVILLYVARQFKDPMFGICAILAMFHDTLVMLGVFSLLGRYLGVEVDTLFVTAMLTILSFSVHDTVVVYDRIRESQRRFSKVPFVDLVNKAVIETLSRSINNSMTIIFMLVALWLLGGATIKWFAFALLVGTVSGTYSSTFTAAPLLIVWQQLKLRKK